MKKYYIYLLLLFLPLISAGQIQLGIKGGYIYYWFTEPNDGQYIYHYDYTHNAFAVAVSIQQRSLRTFTIAYEIEYTNKSFSVYSDEPGLGGGGSVNYHYTIGNIYLQIRPQFTFGSKVKFFFYPGFYFGTLLHSSLEGTKYSWRMGSPSITDTISGTAKGYYPDIESGILFGLGINVPVYKNLTFVFENNISMNLLAFAGAWGSSSIKMFNLNFELGLAYTFGNPRTKSVDQ